MFANMKNYIFTETLCASINRNHMTQRTARLHQLAFLSSRTEEKLCPVWEWYSEVKREDVPMNAEHCGLEEVNRSTRRRTITISALLTADDVCLNRAEAVLDNNKCVCLCLTA